MDNKQYTDLKNFILVKFNELITTTSGGGGTSNVDVVSNTAGLATGADITALQSALTTALADLPNIELNTDQINLNTDQLETLLNSLLTAVGLLAKLTDTQPVSIQNTPTVNTGLNPLTDTQLRASAVPVSVSGVAQESTLGSIEDNVKHKLNRIKGASNYTSAITYAGVTTKINTITHTGTTDVGAETLTATYTYDGSDRLTNIAYS